MLDVAELIVRLMNAKRVNNPVFIVMRIIIQDPRLLKKGKKGKKILCIQRKERVSRGQATHIFNRINPYYGMNYSNAVNRASATTRENEPRPPQLSNPAHQEAPEQSAATDSAEEMEAETMTKRKLADVSHEDQRHERATGKKKKPTEV